MVKKIRRFNGRNFRLKSTHRLKRIANAKGKALDKVRGFAYRISKTKQGHHLYVRRKS